MLIVVALAVFVTALDNSIVNVALPSIQADLGLDLAGVAWVVNGYILSFAVLLLTGGRLAVSFCRRRVFLIGLTGFTVTSLAAGLAPSAGALIAARVLQGLGAGTDDAAQPGHHQSHVPRPEGARPLHRQARRTRDAALAHRGRARGHGRRPDTAQRHR
jgi:MFS family permease